MSQSLHDLIGHSGINGGDPQSLHDHLQGVAGLAATFAESFGSEAFAEWLGWWHDAGKVDEDVQRYLRGETDWKRGPDHSSAGMLEAWDACNPLAINIAGHHGGLADRSDLKDRVARKAEEGRVVQAREQAKSTLQSIAPAPDLRTVPTFLNRGSKKEQGRRIAFWLRMLHSALVDADCLDTEAHFQPSQADVRSRPSPRIEALSDKLEAEQATLLTEAAPTGVNRVRSAVYRACLDAAELSPGFFSLTVPTGGGKTRSVMAFALRHAARHNLRRAIVALPYTSIIEQNADVYRDLLGGDAVLEHHSAVEARGEPGEESEVEWRLRLAAENWGAPVTVTTTVQLLESLYASRNGRLRKLHRIARSVIVLDEAQTLPPELFKPTLEALRFLVEDYGCTVVLCTATQPAFAHRDGADYDGLSDVREIAPEPNAIYQALKRVRYDVRVHERWTWDEAADAMQEVPQALAVLNTVADALALFDALDDPDAFHLSTRLCGAHRRAVLKEVRRRLEAEADVRLVSTQVVEAGVDVDFPLVLRAFGPLASLIQAAGRCNREGRLAEGRVIVFDPAEGKLPPGAYTAGTDVTKTLLRKYGDAIAEKLHEPSLPLEYFALLYGTQTLDKNRVLALSESLSFRSVARAYRLIPDETVGVVVRYRDGDHPKRERRLDQIARRGFATRDDFRALQPYTVSLRKPDHERAVQEGLASEVAPGLWRWLGSYDGDLHGRGLQWALDAIDLIW